jgi:DNA-binding LacI/PurR family transcriptional regulator
MYEVGTNAFDLVSGAIAEKYVSPQDLLLPVKLLVRESTGESALERCSA